MRNIAPGEVFENKFKNNVFFLGLCGFCLEFLCTKRVVGAFFIVWGFCFGGIWGGDLLGFWVFVFGLLWTFIGFWVFFPSVNQNRHTFSNEGRLSQELKGSTARRLLLYYSKDD